MWDRKTPAEREINERNDAEEFERARQEMLEAEEKARALRAAFEARKKAAAAGVPGEKGRGYVTRVLRPHMQLLTDSAAMGMSMREIHRMLADAAIEVSYLGLRNYFIRELPTAYYEHLANARTEKPSRASGDASQTETVEHDLAPPQEATRTSSASESRTNATADKADDFFTKYTGSKPNKEGIKRE